MDSSLKSVQVTISAVPMLVGEPSCPGPHCCRGSPVLQPTPSCNINSLWGPARKTSYISVQRQLLTNSLVLKRSSDFSACVFSSCPFLFCFFAPTAVNWHVFRNETQRREVLRMCHGWRSLQYMHRGTFSTPVKGKSYSVCVFVCVCLNSLSISHENVKKKARLFPLKLPVQGSNDVFVDYLFILFGESSCFFPVCQDWCCFLHFREGVKEAEFPFQQTSLPRPEVHSNIPPTVN